MNKYPYLCVSSIVAKREEALFRDATRQIQDYYASLPHSERVMKDDLHLPSSSSCAGSTSDPVEQTATKIGTSTSPSSEGSDSSHVPQAGNVSIPNRSLASASKFIKLNPCKWPSNILDGLLYLGDYDSACNPLAVKALRISHIINCTPDRINLWEKRPRKKRKIDPDNQQVISTNGITCETPENDSDSENGELEDSIASTLFPDVKIDNYLRYITSLVDIFCS